jgi:DNA adenine methylase
MTLKSKEAVKIRRKPRRRPQDPVPVRPIVKWAGGKTQVLDQIRARYPEGLGVRLTKYAEPFVGSGAVLFDVLSRHTFSEVYISDVNRALINCYTLVRDRVGDVIEGLEYWDREFLASPTVLRRELYENARDRFNHLMKTKGEGPEMASLFIFINHTCFNGLYRVNSNGVYNVPIGRHKTPNILDERNLRGASRILAGMKIFCGDYSLAGDFCGPDTFVYIDPPYRPLSQTSSFTSYATDVFGDNQQQTLADFVDFLVGKGAYVLVSNSDPKNTNPRDNFFDSLYSKYDIHRISAVRLINSRTAARGPITELLIVCRNAESESPLRLSGWDDCR